MERKENLPQMCDMEPMVSIPLSRFEQLLDTETRSVMLVEYTQKERFSISREMIAHHLGFSLKIHKEEQ